VLKRHFCGRNPGTQLLHLLINQQTALPDKKTMKPVIHSQEAFWSYPYHFHPTCTKSPTLSISLLLSFLGWCVTSPRCYCSHCGSFCGQSLSVVLITNSVNGIQKFVPLLFSALPGVSFSAWKSRPHHTAKYFPLKPFIKTHIFTQLMNTVCQPRSKLNKQPLDI